MPRICLIGPTYPYRGGIAHYTTLLAEALRQHHDVLFISFSQQYPRWLFPGRTDRDPSQRPLQTTAEYLLNPLNPFSWWRTLRRMAVWRPDIVILPWWVPFWAPTWATIGRGLKWLRPAPQLLFICHNVIPHESSVVDRIALLMALKPGDGFLVHAQADARRLQQHLPQAPFVVSPHPTYAALGRGEVASLPVVVPEKRPLLLFCGFVRPYKGLDILLAALPYVLVQRPIHLLVAGEFWQGGEQYHAQIKELQLEADVTILDDYLPNEQLAACIQAADVVVLPYRDATQSGVVQLALGYETPVITTNVGGLAEAVSDGRTGLVVPPEDPIALAEAINRFFDEDLGEPFQAAIRVENGRFSWQTLHHSLLALSQKAKQA